MFINIVFLPSTVVAQYFELCIIDLFIEHGGFSTSEFGSIVNTVQHEITLQKQLQHWMTVNQSPHHGNIAQTEGFLL